MHMSDAVAHPMEVRTAGLRKSIGVTSAAIPLIMTGEIIKQAML